MLPGLPPLDGHGDGTDSQGTRSAEASGRAPAEGAGTQTTQMRLRAVGRGSEPVRPDETPQARDADAGRPWPPLAPAVSDAAPERSTSTRLPAVRPVAPTGTGELSATALRPAVRRPMGGWDTMSSLLAPGEASGGRVDDDAAGAYDDQPSSSWLRAPLAGNGEQIEQCKA